MADKYIDVEVRGTKQLAANLAAFGSDRVVGKIIRAALQAGGRLVRPRSASNARALGLGFMGIKRDAIGRTSQRYGRIPKSIKVGRAYIPKGDRNSYRVNVVARGQRSTGIYKNRAPHAHLVEYGFTHRSGTRVAGRPFHGPALTATAPQVTERIRAEMAKRIDAERFPQGVTT